MAWMARSNDSALVAREYVTLDGLAAEPLETMLVALR
jgi:hypothetical protein